MTTHHPLPAEGGSYIRHPDGSLERIDVPEPMAQPEAQPEEQAPVAAEKPTKTSVKGA